MKAVVLNSFGGVEVLTDAEIPQPTPGEHDLLVQVKASSVNPVDFKIRRGSFGPRPFPAVLGFDVSGVVVAVGSEVKGFAVGDEILGGPSVFGAGSHAEFALCDSRRSVRCFYPFLFLPASSNIVLFTYITVPRSRSRRACHGRRQLDCPWCILLHTTCCWKCSRRQESSALSRLALVVWATSVCRYGCDCCDDPTPLPKSAFFLFVSFQTLTHTPPHSSPYLSPQLAKHQYNMTVIATASSPASLELCKTLGADYVINYKTEDVVKRVQEITNGTLLDVRVSCVVCVRVFVYVPVCLCACVFVSSFVL